jgi:hypothetical protein
MVRRKRAATEGLGATVGLEDGEALASTVGLAL